MSSGIRHTRLVAEVSSENEANEACSVAERMPDGGLVFDRSPGGSLTYVGGGGMWWCDERGSNPRTDPLELLEVDVLSFESHRIRW